MLKPEDVENIVFDKSVSGYKKESVDAFLDEVSETLKELYKELEDTKLKLHEREESVYSTLETAKGLISDISTAAEKRADVILRNAQLDADALTKQTEANVINLKQQEEALKIRIKALKMKFSSALKDELLHIETMESELLSNDNSSNSSN